MSDRLLEIGKTLNWITPLTNIYKDLNNGPHHDFHIDRYAGWSGGRIRRLLTCNGVGLWRLSYTDTLISFRVRKNQAWWAQNILLRENIPILGGQIATAGKRRKSQTPARSLKPGKPADPVDAIFNWLDDFGGWFNL